MQRPESRRRKMKQAKSLCSLVGGSLVSRSLVSRSLFRRCLGLGSIGGHGRRSLIAAVLGLALGATAATLPAPARAAYPDQPINLIVSFAPGGGTDLVARLLARTMEKYLGEGARIVVQNKPGAGGAIGFALLASAPADGYTIGFINTPNVLTVPIERKVPFSWQSFDLIGNVVDDPGNFSVHTSSTILNLKDLAAYAKANPGTVTYGTTGIGSDDHLAMMLFERTAGVTLNHVPFKGAGDVRAALASQQITVGAINVGEALQYEKSGTTIRHLGQASVERTSLAPNLATFREQGYDIVFASLRGVAAPKGLPAAIREKLVSAVKQSIEDPEFRRQAEGMFAPLRYLAPADYAGELAASEASFRKLWDESPWAEK